MWGGLGDGGGGFRFGTLNRILLDNDFKLMARGACRVWLSGFFLVGTLYSSAE